MAFCMECGGSGTVLDVSTKRGPRGGYPVRGTKPCPSCALAAPRPPEPVLVGMPAPISNDLEEAIEAAFWAFDAERKRTGAERDAFKGQMRRLLRSRG